MKPSEIKLTTSQFAKLHNVNNRTLHYYDEIGLFQPNTKGENGYRYYDLSQSLQFEYILMLKDLNMTIAQIKEYVQQPTQQKLIGFAEDKEKEIDAKIKELEGLKREIQAKKERMQLCETIEQTKIEIVECETETLLFVPYDFAESDMNTAFSYIKNIWSIEQIRSGVGAVISSEKILSNDFSKYNGVYTPKLKETAVGNIIIKPKGTYLCCYHKGKWDTLPLAYQKILAFAKENGYKIKGYAYEIGLNELFVSDEKEYITKILIQIEPTS